MDVSTLFRLYNRWKVTNSSVLTSDLRTAILADTIQLCTPSKEHNANRGKNDTLFKDQELLRPNPSARGTHP